ncbi:MULTISPECIES: hypothetical protein [unclassified Crossiella]|uniref:hypothetical protein n=1 Tax=unclassified Crossiella TaxID=2620835 RepID=UPI001FFEA15B|nr:MULTISPECIES: hypothetical protein [unclassified Crossiella]MCK2239866.1 hypothetical protein [Crossiella sp. S99.2]MCK2252574.1 hypothetical protein [Crossiella sp. S99.1]
MRRTLLALLLCLTLTGCAQPAEPLPAAAPTPTTTQPTTPAPATTARSGAETVSLFRDLAAQAVLPVNTVRSKDVQVEDGPMETGPMISCWASLRTLHLVGHGRIWQAPGSRTASTAHLYPSRRAEELITELREQTIQHCPKWQDEEQGSYRVIGEERITVTGKIDGVFAFCADYTVPKEPDLVFCSAYLARNGPGTTMLSTVEITAPKLAVRGNKDNTRLAKIMLQGLAHSADTLLTRLPLP